MSLLKSEPAAAPAAPEAPAELSLEQAADRFSAIYSDTPKDAPVEEEQEPEDSDDSQASQEEDDEGESEGGVPEEEPEAEAEETEDEPKDRPQTVTVVVDGKSQEIPIEEVVKGYQRQADYTRKSQALAEERKALETEMQAVKAERAQYAQLLGALAQRLRQEAKEPDWEKLREEDPIEFASQWAEHERRRRQLELIQAEQLRLEQERQKEQEKQLRQKVEAESVLLLEAIPEWKDSKRANAEKKALLEFGESLGFTPQELDAIYDHRAVVTLYKAWKYDQLQKKKTEVTAKAQSKSVQAPPGPGKAKLSQVTREAKLRQRLVKSGRVEDAAELLKSFL